MTSKVAHSKAKALLKDWNGLLGRIKGLVDRVESWTSQQDNSTGSLKGVFLDLYKLANGRFIHSLDHAGSLSVFLSSCEHKLWPTPL